MEGKRDRCGQTSPGKERGNETGNVVIAHGSVKFCKLTPIDVADESKEPLYGHETDRDCVAPSHVDASRDFFFSSPNEQCGGGGKGRRCQIYLFPCLIDQERNWPQSKLIFRVGNQYAECEKQQQQSFHMADLVQPSKHGHLCLRTYI